MDIRRSLAALILLALSTDAYGDVLLTHLRPLDPFAQNALATGRQHSAFFRSLTAIIDRSDLIVYVSTSRTLPNGVDGHLLLVAAVTGARYLRIVVSADLPPDRFVGVLGHELMHAVEVAGDPEVRDHASLRALYVRIGHSHDGVRFDTPEAVAAGYRVLSELRRIAIRSIRYGNVTDRR